MRTGCERASRPYPTIFSLPTIPYTYIYNIHTYIPVSMLHIHRIFAAKLKKESMLVTSCHDTREVLPYHLIGCPHDIFFSCGGRENCLPTKGGKKVKRESLSHKLQVVLCIFYASVHGSVLRYMVPFLVHLLFCCFYFPSRKFFFFHFPAELNHLMYRWKEYMDICDMNISVCNVEENLWTLGGHWDLWCSDVNWCILYIVSIQFAFLIFKCGHVSLHWTMRPCRKHVF